MADGPSWARVEVGAGVGPLLGLTAAGDVATEVPPETEAPLTMAVICSLYPFSVAWISESGTFWMFLPYSAICAHKTSSCCLLSPSRGLSSVKTSWLARAYVRQSRQL